jgi:hypothetical protein
MSEVAAVGVSGSLGAAAAAEILCRGLWVKETAAAAVASHTILKGWLCWWVLGKGVALLAVVAEVTLGVERLHMQGVAV